MQSGKRQKYCQFGWTGWGSLVPKFEIGTTLHQRTSCNFFISALEAIHSDSAHGLQQHDGML